MGSLNRTQQRRARIALLATTMALAVWLTAGCVSSDETYPYQGGEWGCSTEDKNYWYSQGYQQGRADQAAGVEVLPVRPHEGGG